MSELAGCTVLYTRDHAHYPAFRAHIATLGGQTLHLPLMTTRTLQLSASEISLLHHCDYLVLTSAAAVHHLLPQYRPRATQSIAIGEQTAATLPYPPAVCAPAPYNSEALLAKWQPQGTRIALIAASGGRQLLVETLQKNNEVHIISPYTRENPSCCWPQGLALPNVITIASCQTLDHLLAIIPQPKLKLLQYHACIAAISERVAQYAEKQGFKHKIFAENAGEKRQVAAICRWWKRTQEQRHD